MLQFESRIGSGGFGNVDLVRDLAGNAFARKTFSNNQPASFPDELVPNIRSRFIREASVQANLQHRNIMPVLRSQLGDNPPWFLMPVAASTLDKDLRQDQTLGGNPIAVMMDILAGLEYLHSTGITHRDLKPQNVLKLNFNDGPAYVISDFGLISLRDTQLSVLTQTGMRMGSDYYTAPEIVADLRRASAMSDIYSAGCILHDFFGVDDRIPCSEIQEIGPYADIMRCCTRREPNRRFQSVAALRDAILSVGQAPIVVAQAQVAALIDLLKNNSPLTQQTWRTIVEKVEDESSSSDIRALLSTISIDRIDELIMLSSDLASRLGVEYAKWVKENSFDFNECDGIANRLSRFFTTENIDCQVEVLLAYLEMGTSHNRWYVERKFHDACKPTLDTRIANRLALELRVLGNKACRMVAHMENSIGVNRASLHPSIVSTLIQICPV